MEEKILAVLKRFSSIAYSDLCVLVLAGAFTFKAEREFKVALLELQNAGKVIGPGGIFGHWRIAAPVSDGGGETKSRGRARATK